MEYHAHLLVHVVLPGQLLRPLELVAASRMAATVKKTALIAEVTGGMQVRFLSLTSQLDGPGMKGGGRSGRYNRKRRSTDHKCELPEGGCMKE